MRNGPATSPKTWYTVCAPTEYAKYRSARRQSERMVSDKEYSEPPQKPPTPCNAMNEAGPCRTIEAALATSRPMSVTEATRRHELRRIQRLAARAAKVEPTITTDDTIPTCCSVYLRSNTTASANCGINRKVAIATVLS